MNLRIKEILIFSLSLLVLILAASLFPVYEVSEAREGVVVQTMLATNNWILPLRQGEVIPSKPILFHWIGASLAKVFAVYNDLLLRMPSIIAASLMLLASYVFSKRFFGIQTAFFCSAALLTTHGFFQLGIDGRVDMLFAFFVCAAVLIWLSSAITIYNQRLACSKIPELRYLLVAIFCGLAALTKGPLGIALPGVTILLMALTLWGLLPSLSVFRVSWAVSLLIPGIWYYLAWEQGGDAFIGKHLFFENINRFSGAEGITKKPWWFYLAHIWGESAPWSLLLFYPGVFRKLRLSIQSKDPLYVSLLVWIISTVFIFSLSSGKRSAYLLPILPAIIILLISTFLKVYKREPNEIKKSKILISSFAPLLLLAITFFVISIFPINNIDLETRNTIVAMLQSFNSYGLVAFCSLLFFGALNLELFKDYNLKRNSNYLFAAIVLINLQVIAVLIPFFISVKAKTHTMQNLSELVRSVVPRGEKLIAVKTYQDESLDVFFYLYPGKTGIIVPSALGKMEAGYYIAVQKHLANIRQTADLAGKTVEQVAIGKRPSDEDDQLFSILKIN